jgi:hypothetical protein
MPFGRALARRIKYMNCCSIWSSEILLMSHIGRAQSGNPNISSQHISGWCLRATLPDGSKKTRRVQRWLLRINLILLERALARIF